MSSHNHGSGGCGHGHGHGHDHGQAGLNGEELGVQYSLYQKIDLENVTCLNEEIENSGKDVFKAWENRKDRTKVVCSDADEELLFNIPFTGDIKLKGLIVMGGEHGHHPAKVKLFKNRPHMSFDDAQAKCDQEFELVQDNEGTLEYATKVVTFSGVHHLSLYFPSNFGEDVTKIYYVGLKGEFTPSTRVGVVNAVYEARPMMKDHQQDIKQEGYGKPGF